MERNNVRNRRNYSAPKYDNPSNRIPSSNTIPKGIRDSEFLLAPTHRVRQRGKSSFSAIRKTGNGWKWLRMADNESECPNDLFPPLGTTLSVESTNKYKI